MENEFGDSDLFKLNLFSKFLVKLTFILNREAVNLNGQQQHANFCIQGSLVQILGGIFHLVTPLNLGLSGQS